MTNVLSDMDKPNLNTNEYAYGREFDVGSDQNIATDIASVYPAQWHKGVKEQVRQLCLLEANWDKMGSAPIRKDVIDFALHLLERTLPRMAPEPKLTPISNGGILIEWHTSEIDLEIEVEKPFSIYLDFEDRKNSFEQNKEISTDLTEISNYLILLTRRAGHTPEP